jgi:catechol 2,3-dioxygenase-like lactoylglutathione lyase family enzyme
MLSFKSIVLVSENPEVTAAFYRDALGIPLESEQHRGTLRHYAAMVGQEHFAIHAREGFWLPAAPGGEGTIVSFTVEDLDGMIAQLHARGIPIAAQTKIGPMRFLAVRDPDGRYVCCGTPWPAR